MQTVDDKKSNHGVPADANWSLPIDFFWESFTCQERRKLSASAATVGPLNPG
jgi:hypothetical protein